MSYTWNGDQLVSALREGAMTAIIRGTERVLSRAVSSVVSGPKTGAITRRRGVVHQASAPGEAPASDTGRLAQSGRTEYDRAELSGQVIFSTIYAQHLELGTENMEPRPFMRPALAAEIEAIGVDVQAAVRKVLGDRRAGAMG